MIGGGMRRPARTQQSERLNYTALRNAERAVFMILIAPNNSHSAAQSLFNAVARLRADNERKRMKSFLAVVLTLALSSVTLSALAQGHHGAGHRNHAEHDQQYGRGGDYGAQGWDQHGGRDNQGRGGQYRDNQGRTDYPGRDNQGRHDQRAWDRNNRGRDEHHGVQRRHDHNWNHPGWDRRDWRRSWNHGWSGSRHRSTTRYYYPRGFRARHWNVGIRLPPVFYGASYYVNYSSYGLAPPPWGCQWIRIDSDILLVDLSSGEVMDVLYGFYY